MRPDSTPDPSTIPFETSREAHRSRANRSRLGRPRALDDAKRREVCAFVAGGCGLREAARYVRCSLATISRAAERSPDFDDQLRQSEAFARLNPLRVMQQAAQTHWRAAAWLLERAFPKQFGRRTPGMFGARAARALMKEVLSIIRAAFSNPFKADDVERRLRGAFEYHIRTVCDELRDSRSLRAAMKSFEDKDRISGPLASLGIPTPEHLYRPASAPRTNPPTRSSRPAAPEPVAESQEKSVPHEGAIPTARRGHAPVRRESNTAQCESPSVRRGSPDPAATPTAGLHTNAPPMTNQSQPTPIRPAPCHSGTRPSPAPDRKPIPQTAPPRSERPRDALARPDFPAGPLATFIRAMTKQLEAHMQASATSDPADSKIP